MDTGWTLAQVGYDFVGLRVEVEGMYHSNTGSAVVAFPTGYATVSGKIEQVSVMATSSTISSRSDDHPYVGGGLGVGFVDANIQGCKMCLAMFAYQGILAWATTPRRRCASAWKAATTERPIRVPTSTTHHGVAGVALSLASPRWSTAAASARGHAALVHGVSSIGIGRTCRSRR